MSHKKVLIAADHAGFQLKELILKNSKNFNVEFIDLGTFNEESVDYPDYAKKLCMALLDGEAAQGILVCGSAQGMAIQANRFKKIRAAICWTVEVAKLSRAHNDSNVLCLAGRLTDHTLALEITKTWLTTAFEGGRHVKRTEKFDC
jgi:ribose 5-phosphate isomerase B